MFIDVFYLVIYIILIICFTYLGASSYTNRHGLDTILAAFSIIIVIIIFPIGYEKAILTEYEFSDSRESGRIEYISPFDGEKKVDDITILSLYNDMTKHNDIRMEKYYSILHISFGEHFVIED